MGWGNGPRMRSVCRSQLHVNETEHLNGVFLNMEDHSVSFEYHVPYVRVIEIHGLAIEHGLGRYLTDSLHQGRTELPCPRRAVQRDEVKLTLEAVEKRPLNLSSG